MPDLVFQVRFDSAKGAADFKSVLSEMGVQFEQTAKKGGDALSKAFKFTTLTNAATQVSQFANDLLQPFIQFDQSLAGLSAITGLTGKAIDDLGDKAKAMAAKFGGSASDQIASFQGVLSKLGPQLAGTPEQLAIVSDSINTLGKAGGINAAEAMDALTNSMLQFRVNTNDANEVAAKSNEFMNDLAKSAQLGAAEIPQVKEAIIVAGSAAAGANVSFAETNSAIQVIAANAGKYGSEAGTGLRNVFGLLQKNSTEAKKALASIGVDFTHLGQTLNQKGLAAAMEELNKGLSKVGSSAERNAIVMQVFGTENASVADALLRGTGVMKEWTKAISDDTKSGAEQAATNMNTIQGTLDRFQARLKNFAISIGQGVGKPVVTAFAGLAQVAPQLTALTQLKQLIPDGAIQSVGNLAKSLVSTLIPSIFGATTAQTGLNVAMEANPIGAILLAITALGAAIYAAYKFVPGFKEAFDQGFSDIKATLSSLVDDIAPTFTGIFEGLKSAFNELKPTIQAVGGFLVGFFTTYVKAVIGSIAVAINVIKGYITVIIAIIGTVLTPLKLVFTALYENVLKPLAEFIGGALSDAWQFLSTTFEQVKLALQPVGEAISQFKKLFSEVFAAIGSVASAVIKPLIDLLGGGSGLAGAAGKAASGTRESGLAMTAMSGAAGQASGVVKLLGGAFQFVSNIVNGVIQGLKFVRAGFQTFVESVADIPTFLSALFKELSKISLVDALNPFADKNALDVILDSVGRAAEGIKQRFIKNLGGINRADMFGALESGAGGGHVEMPVVVEAVPTTDPPPPGGKGAGNVKQEIAKKVVSFIDDIKSFIQTRRELSDAFKLTLTVDPQLKLVEQTEQKLSADRKKITDTYDKATDTLSAAIKDLAERKKKDPKLKEILQFEYIDSDGVTKKITGSESAIRAALTSERNKTLALFDDYAVAQRKAVTAAYDFKFLTETDAIESKARIETLKQSIAQIERMDSDSVALRTRLANERIELIELETREQLTALVATLPMFKQQQAAIESIKDTGRLTGAEIVRMLELMQKAFVDTATGKDITSLLNELTALQEKAGIKLAVTTTTFEIPPTYKTQIAGVVAAGEDAVTDAARGTTKGIVKAVTDDAKKVAKEQFVSIAQVIGDSLKKGFATGRAEASKFRDELKAINAEYKAGKISLEQFYEKRSELSAKAAADEKQRGVGQILLQTLQATGEHAQRLFQTQLDDTLKKFNVMKKEGDVFVEDADAKGKAMDQLWGGIALTAAAGIAQTLGSVLSGAQSFGDGFITLLFDLLERMIPIITAMITGLSLASLESIATAGLAGLAKAAGITLLLEAAVAVARAAIGRESGGWMTSEQFYRIAEGNRPEFITNAKSSERYAGLLEQINRNNRPAIGQWFVDNAGKLGIDEVIRRSHSIGEQLALQEANKHLSMIRLHTKATVDATNRQNAQIADLRADVRHIKNIALDRKETRANSVTVNTNVSRY